MVSDSEAFRRAFEEGDTPEERERLFEQFKEEGDGGGGGGSGSGGGGGSRSGGSGGGSNGGGAGGTSESRQSADPSQRVAPSPEPDPEPDRDSGRSRDRDQQRDRDRSSDGGGSGGGGGGGTSESRQSADPAQRVAPSPDPDQQRSRDTSDGDGDGGGDGGTPESQQSADPSDRIDTTPPQGESRPDQETSDGTPESAAAADPAERVAPDTGQDETTDTSDGEDSGTGESQQSADPAERLGGGRQTPEDTGRQDSGDADGGDGTVAVGTPGGGTAQVDPETGDVVSVDEPARDRRRDERPEQGVETGDERLTPEQEIQAQEFEQQIIENQRALTDPEQVRVTFDEDEGVLRPELTEAGEAAFERAGEQREAGQLRGPDIDESARIALLSEMPAGGDGESAVSTEEATPDPKRAADRQAAGQLRGPDIEPSDRLAAEGEVSQDAVDETRDELSPEGIARIELENQLEDQFDREFEPGEDFEVQQTGSGFRAELTEDTRSELLEEELEQQFEGDFEPGRDFEVVETDEGVRAELTEVGQARAAAESDLERQYDVFRAEQRETFFGEIDAFTEGIQEGIAESEPVSATVEAVDAATPDAEDPLVQRPLESLRATRREVEAAVEGATPGRDSPLVQRPLTAGRATVEATETAVDEATPGVESPLVQRPLESLRATRREVEAAVEGATPDADSPLVQRPLTSGEAAVEASVETVDDATPDAEDPLVQRPLEAGRAVPGGLRTIRDELADAQNEEIAAGLTVEQFLEGPETVSGDTELLARTSPATTTAFGAGRISGPSPGQLRGLAAASGVVAGGGTAAALSDPVGEGDLPTGPVIEEPELPVPEEPMIDRSEVEVPEDAEPGFDSELPVQESVRDQPELLPTEDTRFGPAEQRQGEVPVPSEPTDRFPAEFPLTAGRQRGRQRESIDEALENFRERRRRSREARQRRSRRQERRERQRERRQERREQRRGRRDDRRDRLQEQRERLREARERAVEDGEPGVGGFRIVDGGRSMDLEEVDTGRTSLLLQPELSRAVRAERQREATQPELDAAEAVEIGTEPPGVREDTIPRVTAGTETRVQQAQRMDVEQAQTPVLEGDTVTQPRVDQDQRQRQVQDQQQRQEQRQALQQEQAERLRDRTIETQVPETVQGQRFGQGTGTPTVATPEVPGFGFGTPTEPRFEPPFIPITPTTNITQQRSRGDIDPELGLGDPEREEEPDGLAPFVNPVAGAGLALSLTFGFGNPLETAAQERASLFEQVGEQQDAADIRDQLMEE